MLGRKMLLLVLIGFFSFSISLSATEEEEVESGGVTFATDLKAASEQAKKQRIPMMMYFAAEDCEFCERLEADYLQAMASSEAYKKKIIIRKIVIDSYDDFRDFNGKVVEASDFSDVFNIQVTPTLVFVDHNGSRLGKRIIGYNASGFFGAELDNAIDAAAQKVR